jgi:hypothetical protein
LVLICEKLPVAFEATGRSGLLLIDFMFEELDGLDEGAW